VKSRFPVSCLALSFLWLQVLAGVAFAQSPDAFTRFDRDGDGKVTPTELPNAATFAKFDRNGDGVITRKEYQQVAGGATGGAAKPAGALGANRAAEDAQVYRPDSDGPVPLSNSKAFTDLRFSRDLKFGSQDRSGKLITATECNYLVAHNGKLFAAVGVWNIDDSKGPNPGPSILCKPAADAPWQVDRQFGPLNARVPVLASLTFTTDAAGKTLPQPASLLMAGSSGIENPGSYVVYVRDDARGEWVKSTVANISRGRALELRHLFVHRDKVTGIDHVFAVVSGGAVFRGGYDPAAPGRIRWHTEPELDGRLARIMSWGQANGDAYLAVDITPDAPKNGGLFRRIDGPKPRWEWIGEWGHRHTHKGVAWIRGLTAIPDPANPGKELLLCSREVDGVIEIIDPQRSHEVRVEFDLRKHFGALVGAKEGQRLGMIFAYNEMTPAEHSVTGERVHLIGGGLMPDLRGDDARAKGAWCLIRHADGRYATVRVFDPEVIPTGHGGLRCVRTICPSPFPEEKNRVLYFGGYDGGDLGTGMKHRDTAWIYKAVVDTQ
jgi:hypothetical protein